MTFELKTVLQRRAIAFNGKDLEPSIGILSEGDPRPDIAAEIGPGPPVRALAGLDLDNALNLIADSADRENLQPPILPLPNAYSRQDGAAKTRPP